MGYIYLQDLDIINYKAQAIDITNFNMALQRIQTFVNQMNENLNINLDLKPKYGTTLPEGDDGDVFVLLE